MQQKSNSNNASNTNKVIITKPWWNPDMKLYIIFRKIIEFGIM